MEEKLRILDTFKTVKSIARVVKPEKALGNEDTFYHTLKNYNICVNCIKPGTTGKYSNDFNYADTIWYEKCNGDFDDAFEAKKNEIDLIFRLDVIRLAGKNVKMYRYLGAFVLDNEGEQMGSKVREWHYIKGYDEYSDN